MKGLFILSYLSFWFFMFCMWCYGIFLAFSASLWIGVLSLLLEPAPAIFGIVKFFLDKNLAQIIYNGLVN